MAKARTEQVCEEVPPEDHHVVELAVEGHLQANEDKFNEHFATPMPTATSPTPASNVSTTSRSLFSSPHYA